MKKRLITSFLLMSFLIFSAIVSAQTTNTATTTNPIAAFIAKEVSSDAFKIIGAPTTLLFQNLIIYLLFILIAYIIITDILNGVNLFEKKWFNYAISLIVILIGVYSGIVYQFTLNITKIQLADKNIAIIVLLIFAIYLVVRTFLKIINRNKKVSQEKAEDEAIRLRTLRRVQEIEARSRGIE